KRVIAIAAVVCFGAAATLPFFGGSFLPEFQEGHFIVHMAAVPGTSIQESLRLGRGVRAELLKNTYVRSVWPVVGCADMGDAAREVAAAISKSHGAADVQVESPAGAPQLVVRLRAERLRQFGFQPVVVLEAIQTAYQGSVVAQTYEGNRVFDVAVILDAASRR